MGSQYQAILLRRSLVILGGASYLPFIPSLAVPSQFTNFSVKTKPKGVPPSAILATIVHGPLGPALRQLLVDQNHVGPNHPPSEDYLEASPEQLAFQYGSGSSCR
jgi:hypothetical protein